MAFSPLLHHPVLHTNEVSVLEIESIELIACLFGVVHVLVDNKRGPLGVVRDTLTYLPDKGEQIMVKHGLFSLWQKLMLGYSRLTEWAQTCRKGRRVAQQ